MRPSTSPFNRLRERREQRMNFHGLVGAGKEIYSKFTRKIYSEFTLSRLGGTCFFLPLISLTFAEDFQLQIYFLLSNSVRIFGKILSKDFERSDP